MNSWFDEFEAIPEARPANLNADDDDFIEETEESAFDLERIQRVKTLLYKVHQRNTGVLNIEDYVRYLSEI